MGYEMRLSKITPEGKPFDLDDVLWFSCGWNLTELHDAIACACGQTPRFDTDCVIETEDLAFIGKVAKQVRDNPLWDLIERLGALDVDYAMEFEESLPPMVKATLQLSYSLEDATDEQREVLRILLEIHENYGWTPILGIADALAQAKSEGLERIMLYGG